MLGASLTHTCLFPLQRQERIPHGCGHQGRGCLCLIGSLTSNLYACMMFDFNFTLSKCSRALTHFIRIFRRAEQSKDSQ